MNASRARLRATLLPLALAAAVPTLARAQAPALAETVVAATRFPEPSQSLPFGVSVVTAEDIRRAGATTVNDALMRVLGIPGRQDFYGGGEYALDLRGFGTTADNNQVIVLDGVRLNESDLGGTRLAGIPIESVERIEVLRGSGAVLYGEGATAGVIVITTKARAGRERPNAASLYAGAGTYNLREGRASATLGGQGFTFDVAGTKRDSDNHRENFRSKVVAQSAAAQWTGDRVLLGLRASRDDLGTGLPGALSLAQFAADPRQTTTPDDRASIRNGLLTAFGELALQDWTLGVDVGRRDKQLRSFSAAVGAYDYDIDASNVALRARNSTNFGAVTNILVIGHDLDHWTRRTSFGVLGTQSTSAVYAKDDVVLPTGTRLSAGWRTTRLRKDVDDGFAPVSLGDRLNAWELGASQAVAGDWTAYGRVGRSFRLANVDEFSFTTPGVPLRPQTSRDTELGVRFKQAGTSVDARLFRSSITDEIGFDPNGINPFGPSGANVNFDPSVHQGLEIDARQDVAPGWTLQAHGTLRRARFDSGPYAGRDVPLAPRQTLALRAAWAPAQGQQLSGGVAWTGARYADFGNTCRIGGHATVDARYAYQWKNVELSLGATNLLNRRFYTQAFLAPGADCASGLAVYPEPGRAVTAAVRVAL